LKKFFIYAQTFWALWKNPDAGLFLESLRIFILPDNFGQIIKVEKSYCLSFPVLSNTKESTLLRTTLEALVILVGNLLLCFLKMRWWICEPYLFMINP
jgi:hypothetical protein